MSEQTTAPFVVTCPDCEVTKATDDPDETVAFHRRHRNLTGHDVVWTRAALDVESGDATDLKPVVAALDDQFEDGVPIGIVCAAMSERGRSIRETLASIHTLRMRGELYEPRDDHLRPF